MKKTSATLELANLIITMTDPKLPKWQKEQLEINARIKAKNYIRSTTDRRV